MLILFALFALFLWALAKAPQDVIKLGLTLLWATMAIGCAASLASSLVPRLLP